MKCYKYSYCHFFLSTYITVMHALEIVLAMKRYNRIEENNNIH